MLGSFGNFLNSKAAENILGLGSLGANIWSGINQQKMANKQYQLQKDAFNFNKFLSMDDYNRRKDNEQRLANVWGNSQYAGIDPEKAKAFGRGMKQRAESYV